jgi:hypothetical protein
MARGHARAQGISHQALRFLLDLAQVLRSIDALGVE